MSSSIRTAGRRIRPTTWLDKSCSAFGPPSLFPCNAYSPQSSASAPRFLHQVGPRSNLQSFQPRHFSSTPKRHASIAPSTPKLDDDGHIALSHIRTLAVIAHVDHGKTTLVDQLLRQSGTIEKLSDASLLAAGGSGNDSGFTTRAMDSNDLEKERGITILSKCTSVNYNGHLIKSVAVWLPQSFLTCARAQHASCIPHSY